MSVSDTIRLASGRGEAEIALAGAEPLVWRVDGRDLLWSGDPDHWAFRAPILFPVVGASRNGEVRVGPTSYPMAQHGFARRAVFALVERTESRARLRLVDDAETRTHYPFAFRLDVTASVEESDLRLAFVVTNTGDEPMPYGLGFHPAFLWPFDAPDRRGHRVVFEAEEAREVPEVASGGLLARTGREVPLDGRVLPLDPEMFTEALVFLDARSRSFVFESPTGRGVEMRMEGFPHLAVWSRPTAPFLSLEAWTAHADWADADGDLMTRPSMIHLAPGETGRHAVTMSLRKPRP